MSPPAALHTEVSNLQPGDHLCCIYETDEEHRALLTPYLRQGLERNEKVVYIVDARTAETVLGYLREGGLEPRPYLDKGQLVILTVSDAYMREGAFIPDRMISFLRQETDRAVAEGYGALRVTGEMSWALRGLPGSHRLIEYESKLNTFIPGSRSLAVCQYDKRRFSSEVLLQVLATHPIAVVGTETFENFHYVSPEEFLTHDFSTAILEHWIEGLRLRKRSKATEEALQESEEKFRLIFDNANDGILLADVESMKFQMGNRKICEMLGYGQEEIPHLGVRDIHPEEDLQDVLDKFEKQAQRKLIIISDIPVKRKDGSVFYADINSSLITFGDRRFLMGHFRDVTQVRVLRKQLHTAQKMEAVGNLAGGIAHDFNNVLTGIFGYGEMLKSQLSGNERATSALNEILRCAERAATLTRQLLTYARRQIIEPVNLDLNAVITDLTKLISTVVGEHIEIRTFLAKDLPTIRADRGQMEQVLMNLVLNARDAMAGGGQVLIETEVVNLDAEYVRYHPYMSVGSYVNLAVSDTGTGMDVKTQERVFEPFFTTKGPDKGTGLGLAMVYGIVKQNNGFIHLYSEPGKGTTFRIYLPPVEAAPDVTISSKPSEIRGGTETILLAEDNESVRMLVERTLTELGYTVLVARNGEEAVEVFKSSREKIDLVILDMVMPRKGGKETYEEMHRSSPDLKVIFTSGYTVNTVHESFVLIAGVPFLAKPFSPGVLARKVREVLDMQGRGYPTRQR